MGEEQGRKAEFPVAGAHRLEGVVGGALPVVEVSYEVDAAGIGGPFPYYPALGILVEAVI